MTHAFGFPLEVIVVLIVAVTGSVWLDLYVHRDEREITLRDAALWSVFWVALSCVFGVYLGFRYSPDAAQLFFAGWAMEKALSVDNLLVFVAIFRYFRLSSAVQHRVLYYGIAGAVVLRLLFVAAGSSLQVLGPWADLIFAVIVGWSAVKMLRSGGDSDGDCEDFSDHAVVRWAQKVLPVVPRLDGRHLFVSAERATELLGMPPVKAGLRVAERYATPALVCILVVEASDMMFAFDSVPTVIAVTREPVLVYSAMLFAVLGLRSLYFLLAALTRWLVYLEKSVIFLLFFVAAKLGLHAANELLHWPGWEPSAGASLAVIGLTLAGGVVASVLWPKATDEKHESGGERESEPGDEVIERERRVENSP